MNRVLLDDWEEHQALMLSLSDVAGTPAGDLEERPYLEVALFWGPAWQDYPRDTGALSRLSPSQANQHGRFYPAVGSDQGALFLFDDQTDRSIVLRPRAVETPGINILRARGVPTRIEPGAPSAWWRPGLVEGAMATVVLTGLAAGALVARRRWTRSVP